MKNKKLLLIIPMAAAILMAAAVYGWAAPCKGMLETVSGKEVHMACFYLKVPSLVMSVMWIAIGIDGLRSKRISSLLLMVSGILTVFMTIERIGGMKICAAPEMSCHITVWWIRALGVLVTLSGLLAIYNPDKQV